MSSTMYAERRKSERRETAIDGTLNSSVSSKVPVSIVDLSSEGFSAGIRSRGPMSGSKFAVRFGGLEVLGAELRWNAGDLAGFEFDRPLHPAVLDHVVRENPPPAEED